MTEPKPTAEQAAREVQAELAALADPRILAVNEKHGDDHAVNLTALRSVAKAWKGTPGLAEQLWETGDTAARLVAILLMTPRTMGPDQIDALLRDARTPKVHDWLLAYVVRKSKHVPQLRAAWFRDPDPVIASAGWALTSDAVAKEPDALDLSGLLDVIEQDMATAPPRLQWAMNTCLATIGIEHAALRARALEIGERLGVLKDYPTPPNCTSPYAPIWIREIVGRREEA